MLEFLKDLLENHPVKLFLIFLILIFLLSCILFLLLILISRSKKIRREIYGHKNSKHIQKLLFSVAFDGVPFKSYKNEEEFKRNWRRRIYREQFLSELLKLHQLYEGEIRENLKKCYVNSGLMQLSFEKIRSRKWHVKCAGIQELGEMRIKKAIPVIMEYTRSNNDTLKMVALIEVIHLKGLPGLSLLKDYTQTLNDWIQLNLIESIKEAEPEEVPDFGYMLESQNESIVVFGLRLLELFHQNQHLEAVRQLTHSTSQKVSLQATATYQKWTSIFGESEEVSRTPLQIPYQLNPAEAVESYDKKAVVIVIIVIAAVLLATLTFLWLGS